MFVYVVGTALLLGGALYSIWRISVLDRYLAENRRLAQEQWQKMVATQEEILRRLPR